MQYIYFGLIPLVLAGWFVYREVYKKLDDSYDPVTSRDRRQVDYFYLLIFIGIYTWRFGLIAGLLCGLLVTIIRIVWAKAVTTPHEMPKEKQQEIKKAKAKSKP